MIPLFEAVPNISEGRDEAVIAACSDAIARHARLAHVTSDAVHHRSVFTFFGTADEIVAASLALAEVVIERIDLRTHRGVHPRIGALDVLPVIPVEYASMGDAVEVTARLADELWNRVRLPSFFYGESAAKTHGRSLPEVRRGEFEGLERRFVHLRPDTGDRWGHPSAGAVAIGARGPLVAFNVDLASPDLALAKQIASAVRERGGGLRTLRALGLALEGDRVQVSLNITDFSATPISRVVEMIRRRAARAGADVARCELIGLVPREALRAVAMHAFSLEGASNPRKQAGALPTERQQS